MVKFWLCQCCPVLSSTKLNCSITAYAHFQTLIDIVLNTSDEPVRRVVDDEQLPSEMECMSQM